MTRDQIIAKWETLTPRERDAWVEEIIFGDTGVFNVGEYWFCGGNLRFPLPAYTEDIDAAWAVLERMNKTHWVSVMRIAEDANVTGHYVVECGGESVGLKSAPEAISLAAIIAKLSPAE